MVSITGTFSLYRKYVRVIINGVEHDLSNEIPIEVWRKGVGDNIHNLNNPEINWAIRVELSNHVNKIVKEITGMSNIQIIL